MRCDGAVQWLVMKKTAGGTSGKVAKRCGYTVIYELAEGGGFYAHIPALDVTTEGRTLAEAKEMARDAIENSLACLRDFHQPIPEEAGSETVEVSA